MLENTQTTAAPPLYWSQLEVGDWRLYLAASSDGLLFVGSAGQSYAEFEAWADARLPRSERIRNDDKLRPYADELSEYLRGERDRFTFRFDLRGTDFQLAVWQALNAIPYGETCSYSDIAERIRRPAAVRAVGAAIGANPVLIAVPCHRVVGKNGALTGYRGGLDMKTKLLALERKG